MPLKAEPRRFDVGASVMAKWPKTNLYFKGVVIDFNDMDYLIRFEDEDESELAIRFRDVQNVFKRRSRSRSLGRTPTKAAPKSKSPARQKTDGRKSPGRKSPARKSPGRKPSSPIKPAKKEEEPTSTVLRNSIDKSKSEILDIKDSSLNLRNRASHVTTSITTSSRHSARIAAFENKMSEKLNNSIKVDAKTVVKAVEEKNRVLEALKRFAVAVGVTLKVLPLAVITILFAFVLTLLCSTKKCQIQWPDLPRKLSSYYDPKALMIVGGYLASLLILAFIPIGKVVRTKSGAKIRCNGYISLLALSIGIGTLLKMNYNFASVYLLYRHFLVALTAFGTLTSILLYIKSFYASKDSLNPSGNTGYYLVDWIQGREVCPRIGSLDIKFILFRASILLLILLNFVTVAKDLQGKQAGQFSPTLLVFAGLQILSALDFIVFEDSFLTMFEYTNMGMGLISCVGYLNMPFTYTIMCRYVLNHRSELPWYCLVGIVALNLVGYTIMRGANSQKHAFRTNPADPALVHLESIPTSTEKRLLVSSWWGLVRHPNYLGDFLIQISWGALCGFTHAIPWVVISFSLVYLTARIFVVEAACKKKYGLAWTSYTSRVPHRLIPKVF